MTRFKEIERAAGGGTGGNWDCCVDEQETTQTVMTVGKSCRLTTTKNKGRLTSQPHMGRGGDVPTASRGLDEVLQSQEMMTKIIGSFSVTIFFYSICFPRKPTNTPTAEVRHWIGSRLCTLYPYFQRQHQTMSSHDVSIFIILSVISFNFCLL